MDAKRYNELRKLPKRELAEMQHNRGGLLAVAEYMRWTKEELIDAILDSEARSAH